MDHRRTEAVDEDGWPIRTRRPRRSRNSSSSKKNRRQYSRQESCRSSFSSSRKLRRDNAISKMKKKQAKSYLPPRRATSSTSNVVIDSSYRNPTQHSLRSALIEYERNARRQSRRDYTRGTTTRTPAVTATSGNRQSGQALIDQFVESLIAPGGPLNVNNNYIRQLAYDLVQYYEHQKLLDNYYQQQHQRVLAPERSPEPQRVLAPERSPQPLTSDDFNDSIDLAVEPNNNGPQRVIAPPNRRVFFPHEPRNGYRRD